MKNNKVTTEVLVETNSKPFLKSHHVDYRKFEFDLSDVTGVADSVWPAHTDVVIPGGVFTIKIPYESFIKIYNYYNETQKDKN